MMVSWCADGPAVPGDPGQRALDDPAAGQHLERVQVIRPFHDLQRQLRLELGLGPGDELAGVSAVGPGELDLGECLPQVPQQGPGTVAVLDPGCGDQHGQQQPDRVYGHVPLAAVDLLARVVAPAGAGDFLGGLDRLGVDDRRRGLGLAACGDAALAAQLMVYRLGRTGLLPAVGHVVDGAPVRQVRGHRAPLDALLDQVADRVHVVAAAPRGRAPVLASLPRRGGQRGLDDRPLGIAHVRRIAAYPATAADAARAAAAGHHEPGQPRTLGMRGSSRVLDRHKSGSWRPAPACSRNDTPHDATNWS
jgi:hypothetical protein